MASWFKRILENGVLENGLLKEVEPLLEPHQDKIEAITEQGKAVLQQHGLVDEPDAESDPQAALNHRLHQLLRHLLQLPHQRSHYLASELVTQLPSLLALHPQLRGFVGIAQVLAQPQQHQDSSSQRILAIAQGLGGSPWLLRAAQGGQHWINGQQAYDNACERQRHYQQLNSAQQHVVDLATMLLGLLEQAQIDGAQVDYITMQLEMALAVDFEQLAEGLDEEHRGALNGISYGAWPRLA
ncbi:hypothetical protein [Ferrimonas senticii]|uniref:hypothetical protein n=1 Tax=Ferrimonas senticii TaxID=394566 RepID=UPI000426A4AF|nr:hypothetical protein [Ferrimonas senticii]